MKEQKKKNFPKLSGNYAKYQERGANIEPMS